MKLRYQEQMSHKMSSGKSVTQMPKRIFLVDNNDNIDTPHVSNTAKGIVYLDDNVLPHYKYFDEENNNEATAEGRYPDSDDPYTSDNDGHQECGKGNYSH